MNPEIAPQLPQIAHLCREFGVLRLALFGSAVSGQLDAGSDVDFLVEFPPGTRLGPWMRRLTDLKQALERLLHRPVDVVTTEALKNPRFKRVAEQTMTPIYHAPQVPEVAG